MLVQDDVARLGRQLRDNVRIPRVPDEDPAFRTVRGSHHSARAKHEVSRIVGRAGSTGIRKIRPECHLQVDDLHTRPSRQIEDSPCLRDGSADHGRVDTGTVKQSPFGAEVVLHIDDNNRRLGDVDRNRHGLRLDRDDWSRQGFLRRMACHTAVPI